MAQLFRQGANSIAVLVISAIFVVPIGTAFGAYFLWHSPYATGQFETHAQPVPFSHAHHVGDLGIDCRMCHMDVEKTAFASLPSTHVCMTCHSQIWTNADVLAPVRASAADGTPLEWERVNRLPDYVYFDHSIHVAKGVGCSTCHGQVQDMALMRQAQPLTMQWCLDCHRDPARNLRPPDQVFNMDWTPPPDQNRQGVVLMHQYLIEPDHLTDCSTCHR